MLDAPFVVFTADFRWPLYALDCATRKIGRRFLGVDEGRMRDIANEATERVRTPVWTAVQRKLHAL